MNSQTAEWRQIPLRQLFTKLVNGGTPSTAVPAYWNGRTPWVTGADFTSNGIGEIRRYVSDLGVSSSSTSVVESGNILLVTRTGVGKLAIAKEPIAISQDITGVYVDRNKINVDFAYYLLSAELENLKKLNQGTSINGIVRSDLERHIVSVPMTLRGQQKIAHILQTIDQAIEKTEALIEKYQQIKAGLMHDLFTRGIALNGQLRPPREQAPHLYQQNPIGWIPKEWEVMFVQDVFDITSGITLGTHRRPRNHPRPYLRVANVFKEKIDLGDISLLEASDEENARYGLCKLDLLLVEGHANIQQIGRCAIVSDSAEGMLFQNHLFRLRARDISSYYGMYFLNSHIARKYWEKNCSTSSGLNTINRRMLGNMEICVPEKEEQLQIERRLIGINGFINNEKKVLQKLQKQKSGLMNNLLTGKVPVSPAPEPAHD